MISLRHVLLAATAFALPVMPVLAQGAPRNTVTGTMPDTRETQPQTDAAKLSALFEDADERNLELNPLSRIFRGDTENADRLGDYGTDSYFLARRFDAQLNLALLAQIDRNNLNETDTIAYDVFAHNQEQALKGSTQPMRELTEVRPVNHFTGFHTFYPTFASGGGAAPFETLAHYEDNLSRHDDYIIISDRSIGRLREGLESGVTETALSIGRVIEQLDTQLAVPIDESQYMKPTTAFPDAFAQDVKDDLLARYSAKTGEIYAANTRMRDFLRDAYLPSARTSVGLSALPGGKELYATLIESTTTLPLTPDYLHDLGLAEVARVKAGLEDIRVETGFAGTLNEFFDYVREDAQFKPDSREALTQAYYDIGEQVDAKIGDYFSLLPKSPLEIKPYDPAIEQFSAGGSYSPGSPDGSRAGIFYFNAYDLPSRLTTGNVTLYLHEGAPGHHFQISLAQENEALPNFMRFGGNTAYVEGWALYSETLGYEMGFFDDPWNRYGTLQDEQLRAMRLVVDTGLHAKGWTRDEAVAFMLENSGMTRTEVVAEVDRYIAIPSQALAYKVGALKIQELRAEAEAALGDGFDLKAFHAQVLGTGSLPLPVLEAKIERWVEGGGK